MTSGEGAASGRDGRAAEASAIGLGPMRVFLPVALALVAGLLIGAWRPRSEVLELRAEIEALRLEARRGRPSAADGLREVFRAPPPAVPSARGRDAPTDGEARAPAGGEAEAMEVEQGAGGSPVGTEEDFEAFKTGLDARAAQARAALVEQGDLDDETLATVDEVVARMNAELRDAVDDFVAEALEHGEVDRRMMMELGAEALDIAIAADDGLREALPEEVYARLDDAVVDPFSYIDGSAAESLRRVQDLPGIRR